MSLLPVFTLPDPNSLNKNVKVGPVYSALWSTYHHYHHHTTITTIVTAAAAAAAVIATTTSNNNSLKWRCKQKHQMNVNDWTQIYARYKRTPCVIRLLQNLFFAKPIYFASSFFHFISFDFFLLTFSIISCLTTSLLSQIAYRFHQSFIHFLFIQSNQSRFSISKM